MTHIQGIPDPGPGLRLHLNENTAGCSPRVVEAIGQLTNADLALYPDYKAAVLETAAHLGVDPDWLVLTNGLDEGILLASIACLVRRADVDSVAVGAASWPSGAAPQVVITVPAFEAYAVCAKALGAEVVAVPHARDFTFPLDGVLRAISPRTRLVYVNTPHNPSGVPVSADMVREVVARAPHAVVFLDEAYHDFLGENFLAEVRTSPNVMVGRTFSKAYGLAGMRVGVLVAPPPLLEPIRYVMPVYNLSVVAVAALRAALGDTTFTPWYVAQVRESKALVYAALDQLGLRYWESAANFVLIDGGTNARALVDELHRRRIFVRDRTKDPHCPNCFRLTTGVVEHTRHAIAALEQLCVGR